MATSQSELAARELSASMYALTFFNKSEQVAIQRYIDTRNRYRDEYPHATSEISKHEWGILIVELGEQSLKIGLRYASIAEKILTSGSDGTKLQNND